jgi:type III pantothenate kinase
MTQAQGNLATGMLAIEVGSSRIKLGWFPSPGACMSEKPAGNLPISVPALREPAEVARIDHRRDASQWIGDVDAQLAEWNLPTETECVVAVVRQAVADALFERVLSRQSWARIESLGRRDVPLQVDVQHPERLGIDRMLNAVAANRLRRPQRAGIVVDIGTAMTVNFISSDGVFRGGAILAGPSTALDALHAATSSLPKLGREVFDAPPVIIGKSTQDAMAAGAYWGAVGAARQIIERMAAACSDAPDVFLTGGAAEPLAEHVGLGDRRARFVPHLVLSGIRLTAEHGIRRT